MKWLKSKTFWTNIIAAVGSILAVTVGVDVGPEAQAAIVGGVVVVANLVLKAIKDAA